MDTSIQVAAMVVIASFAIDRIAGAVFFLLSMLNGWNALFSGGGAADPDSREAAQKRQKLAYYIFVGALAAVLVFKTRLGVLHSLQLTNYQPSWLLDHLFTVMVLMGGSDQIASLLKSPHAGKAIDAGAPPKPIEVTGRLTLDDGAAHAVRPSQPRPQ